MVWLVCYEPEIQLMRGFTDLSIPLLFSPLPTAPHFFLYLPIPNSLTVTPPLPAAQLTTTEPYTAPRRLLTSTTYNFQHRPTTVTSANTYDEGLTAFCWYVQSIHSWLTECFQPYSIPASEGNSIGCLYLVRPPSHQECSTVHDSTAACRVLSSRPENKAATNKINRQLFGRAPRFNTEARLTRKESYSAEHLPIL